MNVRWPAGTVPQCIPRINFSRAALVDAVLEQLFLTYSQEVLDQDS
jgi:hypothetical protein